MEKIKTVFSILCASFMVWLILLTGGFVYALFSNGGHEGDCTQAFGGAIIAEAHGPDERFVGSVDFTVNPVPSLILLSVIIAVISLGVAAVKYRIKRKPAAKLDSAKEGYVLPEMKTENAAGSAAGSAAESAGSFAESGGLSDFERDELIKQRLAEQKSKQNS
ncbi:MAG: hypothetical protein U0L31_05285 [Bifidobacteriaceae bacterium]|nr:hypothetical protein [Bifidobacteriaceae bacterium]